MKSLFYVAPQTLEWRDVPRPRLLADHEAIVHPVAVTTCDLDQLIIQGKTPFAGSFQIGHECVARVVEVGASVSRVSVGDLVVVNWHISCGACDRCGDRRPNACRAYKSGAMYGLPNLGDWGGAFSDYVRVVHADFNLTTLPPDVDLLAVASAADNLPFGYEYTVPHLLASPGANVLVIGGCGSIGLYAAMFAVAAGASQVEYRDTDSTRLCIASELGASIVDEPIPRSCGRFPIVVDASASTEGLLCAIRSLEPEGIISSVGGHFADLPLPLFEMYTRGTRFYTGRGRGGPNVSEAIKWVLDGRVDPRKVVDCVARLADAPQVLRETKIKPVFLAD
jgi:threonine dehydrogenase-like Zn-dependent dehydrogenase